MARSFKSVGKTSSQVKAEELAQTPAEIPVGIITPLRLGERSEGIFKMHFSLADQIADNLRNLISTNWGERLGQYFFGANLQELTTEIVSQDAFEEEAMARIKATVERWMPYVNLIDFDSSIGNQFAKSTGKVRLTVTYTVAGVQDLPRSLQVDLFII
jgi:phage baseplate assembly protein W